MLDIEGIEDKDKGINECTNVILDGVGFFSIRIAHGFPYVVHFCVDRDKRSPANFYRLAKKCKEVIRSLGFRHVIINAPRYHWVSKFVESYTKRRPYQVDVDQNYYFYGV